MLGVGQHAARHQIVPCDGRRCGQQIGPGCCGRRRRGWRRRGLAQQRRLQQVRQGIAQRQRALREFGTLEFFDRRQFAFKANAISGRQAGVGLVEQMLALFGFDLVGPLARIRALAPLPVEGGQLGLGPVQMIVLHFDFDQRARFGPSLAAQALLSHDGALALTASCRRLSCDSLALADFSATSSARASDILHSPTSAISASTRASIFCRWPGGLAMYQIAASPASTSSQVRKRIGWRSGGALRRSPSSGFNSGICNGLVPKLTLVLARGGAGLTASTMTGAGVGTTRGAGAGTTATSSTGNSSVDWRLPQYGQYATCRGQPRPQASFTQR